VHKEAWKQNDLHKEIQETKFIIADGSASLQFSIKKNERLDTVEATHVKK
jgi:hypothetical protein